MALSNAPRKKTGRKIGTRIPVVLAWALLVPLCAGAAERVYFTSDRASPPGKTETQLFSMNPGGGDVRQHTRSPGTKASAFVAGRMGRSSSGTRTRWRC